MLSKPIKQSEDDPEWTGEIINNSAIQMMIRPKDKV